MMWAGFVWLRIGISEDSCEHDGSTVPHGVGFILTEKHILKVLAVCAVNFEVPKD
jgi:hypothetical protein